MKMAPVLPSTQICSFPREREFRFYSAAPHSISPLLLLIAVRLGGEHCGLGRVVQSDRSLDDDRPVQLLLENSDRPNLHQLQHGEERDHDLHAAPVIAEKLLEQNFCRAAQTVEEQ